jgi:hypothetical protein
MPLPFRTQERFVEKIRRLVSLLDSGIDDYEDASATLQEERLKYLRLSITNAFGVDENTSRASWLAHLQSLENSLNSRLNAIRQAIVNAGMDMQPELDEGIRALAELGATDEPEEPETPDEQDKV